MKIVTSTASSLPTKSRADGCWLQALASLKLTTILLTTIILLTLAGAWIPQVSQTDPLELLDRFGKDGVALLNLTGLSHVFYSLPYLITVFLIFVNLAACTAMRMAPRIRGRLRACDFLDAGAIEDLPVCRVISVKGQRSVTTVYQKMQGHGFTVKTSGSRMIFEKGRIGWLAAPMTHLGLFVLLIGIIVSALVGYSGTVMLSPGQTIDFPPAKADKPYLGSLPHYQLKLTASHRENYKSGEPKQWYSDLVLLASSARQLGQGTTCVNSPLSLRGIDFYQSDWQLSAVRLTLDGDSLKIPLEPMGGDSMGAIPLTTGILMIAALHENESPVRLYLKAEDSHMPRLVTQLNAGETFRLSSLTIKYEGATISSGIHYKFDPGLPIVYASFVLLMLGAVFVSVPQYRLWADASELSPDTYKWTIGCCSTKFGQLLRSELLCLEQELQKLGNAEVSVFER